AVRPGLVLLTETELWPLFLEQAEARGIPVALVNGRISERSFARYRLVRSWFGHVLEKVTLFAMQTADDAERIVFLGAPKDRVRVTGNVKYDLPAGPPFPDATRLRQAAAGRPVLVAASTADREEEMVLAAWKGLDPRPLLAVAPRRPERFAEVARLIEASGFTLLRRSSSDDQIRNPKSEIRNPDVYLLDSIGELTSLYREARLAFVGGSLVASGGHNPIEAWAEGVPVVVGPHTQNFHEVCRRGERLGFLRRAKDGAHLRQEFAAALAEPGATAIRGERARRFVAENRGASAATADLVLPLLESASCEVRAP
ncbi:MAG TPA: glycosyltransferase N-terminal domain-containing protein, partial [Thermoanaerobaculia bacterium]|nr:glycosyltransferase N-terminal domain-containing protein [Thermoanaerobaculia bacterium]